ncbi:MAG: 50S ribosomal protein L10 [Rickettsiales bacterium]|nr:50S ribosomal protein L10 [Rickettsiales bacterium]
MNRLEKKQEISDIKDLVDSYSSTVIVHYQGLNVDQLNFLRGKMRECGAKFKVIKNSLAKLAIANTNSKDLDSLLSGPTALVVSNDPVSMAKELTSFVKTNASLVLLGGVVDEEILDKKSIIVLSDMPSKDELRAKIIGLLNAPATKVVRVLTTPSEQVARVVGAYSNK